MTIITTYPTFHPSIDMQRRISKQFSQGLKEALSRPKVIQKIQQSIKDVTLLIFEQHQHKEVKCLYTNHNPDHMLLASQHTVKLSKRYFKILHLSAAFKDTFVFLGMPSPGKDVLAHCNKAGKILFELNFEFNVDSFGMLNDREAIVLETRKNRITVLNLENHSVSFFPHQFMFEESDQSEIQTFSESRLLCVKEVGNYIDNRMKLTYYGYPLKEGSQPVAVFQAKDDDWTYEYLIRRGNNHSLMIWFKARHDEQFELKTFDLQNDPKGSYAIHKIKNTIGQPYNITRVECAISTMWEVRKGQLLAVCISNKTEAKCENSEGVVNNNFVIDLHTKVVREAKFFFDKKYNDFQIDYYNLGPISMFRTFEFIEGKAMRTPVYYINNQTETIVAQDTWECTYLTKYYIPGFDSSTLMEGEYENSDVDEFKLKIKKVMDPKEIALHFMLHINEDFDDDLLQDALELLDFI